MNGLVVVVVCVGGGMVGIVLLLPLLVVVVVNPPPPPPPPPPPLCHWRAAGFCHASMEQWPKSTRPWKPMTLPPPRKGSIPTGNTKFAMFLSSSSSLWLQAKRAMGRGRRRMRRIIRMGRTARQQQQQARTWRNCNSVTPYGCAWITDSNCSIPSCRMSLKSCGRSCPSGQQRVKRARRPFHPPSCSRNTPRRRPHGRRRRWRLSWSI
mmetsp:Transcript_21053/g.37582  ORF Transcript_21053/g.37582 Transcript_21053/m.37582 type:complete len:208 (-) Transcript_21053:706-1329(-)